MKQSSVAIIIVFLSAFLMAGCQSRFVSDGITGGVVGAIEYGETREERHGTDMMIVKEFHVVADKSIYRPNRLQVEKGDVVRIIIYASNTNHGFVLPSFGINEFIEEDNYKTIEFVADKAGIFTFFSNVYSGPGTSEMEGELIVVDNKE